MAKKFYGVRIGRTPGIYQTWDECRRQVMGFPNASYKGFDNREDAQAFVNGVISEKTENVPNEAHVCAARAYCDGSFDIKTNRFSYGVVLFWQGKELRFCEAFSDPELAAMRNVAGEIKGAEFVMTFCAENEIRSVELIYDYQGVEKWCTGEWKTNKEGTSAYKHLYDSLKNRLLVRFTKVKGHSGDAGNELADQLAKKALGIE